MMSWRLDQVTAPAAYPVSLESLRDHLQLVASGSPETHRDDALVTTYLAAATEAAESATNRALVQQTWELVMDCFPSLDSEPIVLPRPPLQTVDSITYVDLDGITQTWDAALYQVDAPTGPKCGRGRVLPAYGESWPDTRSGVLGAVRIRFTAGYPVAAVSPVTEAALRANVPAMIVAGIKLFVGHLYANRQDVVVGVPGAVQVPEASAACWGPYRSVWVA